MAVVAVQRRQSPQPHSYPRQAGLVMCLTATLGISVGRVEHLDKGQHTCKGCQLGPQRELAQQRLTWKCRLPRGARSTRSLLRLQPLQPHGSYRRAALGRLWHLLRLLCPLRPSSQCSLPPCRRRGRRSLRLKQCRLPYLGGQLWKGQRCRSDQVRRSMRMTLLEWLLRQLAGVRSQRPNGIQGPSLL